MNPWWALVVGLILLGANAFFVAAEFALLAARRSQLEAEAAGGSRAGRLAVRAHQRLTLMLAGAQLGITMCSLGLGVVAEPALASVLEPLLGRALPAAASAALSFVIALGVVVFLHMVVGEMAPKSWALTHPERSTRLLIRPFWVFTTVFRPVLVTLNAAANGVVRLVGVRPRDEMSMARSSAELLVLVRRSHEQGSIDDAAHELLAAGLRLSGVTARDAMTPRDEVVAVGVDETLALFEQRAVASGRSRLLVHGRTLDHPVGVVLVRDLLLADAATATVASLLRPVLVTAPDTALEDLLRQLRDQRQQLAAVMDDGRLAGVVTMQDVLDRLVGAMPEASGHSHRRREGRISG